jgi:hypothetical protein
MEPAVSDILKSIEPTVRRCAGGMVADDGFFLLSVRAAFVKNFEVNQFIHTPGAAVNAFDITGSLRGICEDIIALKWLTTYEKRDRDEAVGVMMMKSVLELMQQQTSFFNTYRPSQPILEAKDVSAEIHGLKQRLRAMRKGNRWKKHREWPSVREMAEPGGLLPLYDFLYAATSSFVHFSPNNLLRMGKPAGPEGATGQRMQFSTLHFADYYSHFNQFYGLFLFVTFCTTFAATLGCKSEIKPAVEQLMKHLDEELRWPELITTEEMNVPAVSQMLRLMAHKARKLATPPAVWAWEDAK